jgi:hypothetical protein
LPTEDNWDLGTWGLGDFIKISKFIDEADDDYLLNCKLQLQDLLV